MPEFAYTPYRGCLRPGMIMLMMVMMIMIGSQVAEWLGNQASNRKVAGSIPGCAE